MRAQGVGSTELNREILDELNGHILKERMEMKINRAMNERLNTVMIDVTQGAAGLARCVGPSDAFRSGQRLGLSFLIRGVQSGMKCVVG